MTAQERSMLSDEQFQCRFWAKVNIPVLKDGMPDRSKCWPWEGARSTGGGRVSGGSTYGHVSYRRKNYKAHRLALAMKTGTMPADMDASHSEGCVKLCCNSTHLSWEAPKVNRYQDVTRRHGHVSGRCRKGVRHWS